VVNGSAVAIWEVINTNPGALENFKFSVFTSYTVSPAPGTVIANLGYSPSPPAFTADAGANASDILPVPRFVTHGHGRNPRCGDRQRNDHGG
jgi:hypothetical protein